MEVTVTQDGACLFNLQSSGPQPAATARQFYQNLLPQLREQQAALNQFLSSHITTEEPEQEADQGSSSS